MLQYSTLRLTLIFFLPLSAVARFPILLWRRQNASCTGHSKWEWPCVAGGTASGRNREEDCGSSAYFQLWVAVWGCMVFVFSFEGFLSFAISLCLCTWREERGEVLGRRTYRLRGLGIAQRLRLCNFSLCCPSNNLSAASSPSFLSSSPPLLSSTQVKNNNNALSCLTTCLVTGCTAQRDPSPR